MRSYEPCDIRIPNHIGSFLTHLLQIGMIVENVPSHNEFVYHFEKLGNIPDEDIHLIHASQR